MRSLLLAVTAAAALLMAAPAFAQTPATPAPTAVKARATTPKTATPKVRREPTAGQLAARDRQKKCGVEWKEAKAKGETGGLKWPQYWSKCNARLKGGGQA